MSSIIVKHNSQQPHYPPTVKGHWFWGTSRDFQRDAITAFNTLFREHGDAIRLRFFPGFYGFIFNHPDHNKHVLQDNNRNYTKMPAPSFVILRPVVGNGLLTNDGDDWRQQRRLAQPAFHRRRIAEFGQTMVEAADTVLDNWYSQAKNGRSLDVAEEMTQLTLEIVGKTLFSMDLTRDAERLGDAFTIVNESASALTVTPFGMILSRIPFWPATRRVNSNMQVLNDVVETIIQRRRQTDANGEAPDLLGLLMAARDEETGAGMSDQQLRDEVMTLLLAGHETTAIALSWTLYLLSEHPDARARLEGEVDSVVNGRLPTIADLPQLTYTNMVLEESMRLYPPAYAISRWCNDADVIGGYDVPAESVVLLSPYLTHRHPEYWPEPDKFDPERFTEEAKQERPRYAYIPFGGGPRQCVGNNFAMTEAALILATICQRYRLDLVPGHPVETDPLITLRPKHGLQMTIVART